MNRLMTLAGAGLALAFSVSIAQAQVVVSSKIDTEGGVLGNIILAVLSKNNIETTDRIQLGATPVVRKAITAGEIDIYAEYTGNAAFFSPRRMTRSGRTPPRPTRKQRRSTMTPTRSFG